MLDDNPVLKERVMAFGAFAGIALFAVASLDVMISGGFDFGPGRAETHRDQRPTAYVRVVDAANYVTDRFREISWDEPMFIDSAEAATPEDLAGANDGSAAPETTSASMDEALYQHIDALYEETQPIEDEPTYDDAVYAEPSDAEADKIASAYGNASPW